MSPVDTRTPPSSVSTFTRACPLTVNVFATSSPRTPAALTSATRPTTRCSTLRLRQSPILMAITSLNLSTHVTHHSPQMFPNPLLWFNPSAGCPWHGVCAWVLGFLFSIFYLPFSALFFPRSSPKNFPAASVFITSFFSSHPLLAILTPYRIKLKFPVLCASVEITTFTPPSLHILKYTSFKSSRSGYELHSIATPCFAQAASTFSMS